MSQIAGLQDFRQEGPPADIGVFQATASVIVFQFTFSGTTYIVAQRMGVQGWTLIDQGPDAATVINSVLVAGDRSILFREGIYNISSEMTVDQDRITLFGIGKGTVFNITANIICFNVNEAGGWVYDITFEKMKIMSTRTTYTPTGIKIKDTNNVIMNEVWFEYIDGEAILLDKTVGLHVSESKFTHCGSTTNSRAAFTASTTSTGNTNIVFLNCTFEPNYYRDIDITGSTQGLWIQFCWFESENIAGTVRPENSHIELGSAVLTNVYISDNFTFDPANATCNWIHASGNVNRISISNNNITSSSTGQLVRFPATISYLRLRDNFLKMTGAGSIMIEVRGGSGQVISGNHIETSTTDIVMYIYGSIDITNNFILANNASTGIYYNWGTGSDISFNDISGPTTSINIQANATNASVLLNRISGAFVDIGVNTRLPTITGEFTKFGGGSAGEVAPVINTSPGGIDLDADNEFAYVRITLTIAVQRVIRIKIWAYSNVIEATNNMLLRLVAHGATSSELWSGNPIDVPNKPSVEEGGIVQYDVVHWVFTPADDAQIGTLVAQDLIEFMAVGEAAVAPDIGTDALFGGYEIEYV